MKTNNRYKEQYALITEENVNVKSNNDLKDFLVLICWVVCAVLLFFSAFKFISAIFINTMSVETQLKIEKLLSNNNQRYFVNKKYQKEIDMLYNAQKQIITNDPKLAHKKRFELYVKPSKEINAWIHPNGTIVFTSGLLDGKLEEQELAFILAHEIGHYSNKDHFRAISNKIAVISACILTGNSTELSTIISGIANLESMRHTRAQEKKADEYASRMMFKIYGSNQGGIDIMKRLQRAERTPEFMQYISDHPRTITRIYWLEKQQIKNN